MNRKITAAFFSPTGGTKRAVETLCACWGGEVNWVQLGTKEPVQINLGADELLVLGLPVYAGVIPQVPGLLDGLKGENTPCVLAAAYGNRNYDDALAQMKRLMEERGFLCVGAAAVVTPHIFAPTLGAGRPDEEDRAVYAAVKALPPKYRAVVHLYYYEGYDQGEIGEILHISRTAVQTRMSRARAMLKKELNGDDGEEIPAYDGAGKHG